MIKKTMLLFAILIQSSVSAEDKTSALELKYAALKIHFEALESRSHLNADIEISQIARKDALFWRNQCVNLISLYEGDKYFTKGKKALTVANENMSSADESISSGESCIMQGDLSIQLKRYDEAAAYYIIADSWFKTGKSQYSVECNADSYFWQAGTFYSSHTSPYNASN